jgi:HD-like signal output (HDOD) protein
MRLTQEKRQELGSQAPPGGELPPERLCKLPVFRPVAVRLLSELAREEPDVAHVIKLLLSDPAFSAEILTLANSALYARHAHTDTIQKAIQFVGLDRTRALTVTVALHGMVRDTMNKVAVQDSWAHSRGAALVGEWLAPFYGIQPDQAYTAALMHDIGRLAMLSAYPEYQVLLATAAGTNPDILEAEKRSFSVNHCEAGRWLTRIWGLPQEFGDTAGKHHEPVAGTPGDRVDLVRLSCLLAQSLDFKVAPQIDCEPAEALIARIPEAIWPHSRVSIPELSEYLWNAMRADASGAL